MYTLLILIVALAIPIILLGSILPAFWHTSARATASYSASTSTLASGGTRPSTAHYRTAVWRRAAWEFHISILGLIAAGAATIFMTEGLKVMIGKPRPDCISRCLPDMANYEDFVISGVASTLSSGQLVSKAICTQKDYHRLNDGFKSFPSGHSSGAAVGLGYLSLYLAGKFGVLSLATSWTNDVTPKSLFASARSLLDPVPLTDVSPSRNQSTHRRQRSDVDEFSSRAPLQRTTRPDHGRLRHNLANASAPALSFTIIAWIPYGIAMFVDASRFHDFRHHAADIFFGFFIGTFFAALGYRFAQLHLARAAGVTVHPPGELDPVAMIEDDDATTTGQKPGRERERQREWRPVAAEDEEANAQAGRSGMQTSDEGLVRSRIGTTSSACPVHVPSRQQGPYGL